MNSDRTMKLGTPISESTVRRDDVDLWVADTGGEAPPVLILHGLAGSSREFAATAAALVPHFRVLLMDQRGHGRSTRRPADTSRRAFVEDAVAVIEHLVPGERVSLVGQSMGAHTAMLVAAARPDLADRLVMLEGSAQGSDDAAEATAIGDYFRSWPPRFADASEAGNVLGTGALAAAWIADLEPTPSGLRPRFDADVMESTIRFVHEPRWAEWRALTVPALAVFGRDGMFSEQQKQDLMAQQSHARRVDLPGGTHDAHLDAFDDWIGVLRPFLLAEPA